MSQDVQSRYIVSACSCSHQTYEVDYYDTSVASEVVKLLNDEPRERKVLDVQFASQDPFPSQPLRESRFHSPASYTLVSAAYGSSINHFSPPSPYDRASFDIPPGYPATPVWRNPAESHNRFEARDPIGSMRNEHIQETSYPSSGPYRGESISNHTLHSTSPVNDQSALQNLLDTVHSNARAQAHQRAFNPPPAAVPAWSSRIDLAAIATDRQAIPPENRVYPERLLAGHDNRTTVMVKDVPVSRAPTFVLTAEQALSPAAREHPA